MPENSAPARPAFKVPPLKLHVPVALFVIALTVSVPPFRLTMAVVPLAAPAVRVLLIVSAALPATVSVAMPMFVGAMFKAVLLVNCAVLLR